MKRSLLTLPALLAAGACVASCSSGFGTLTSQARLVVTIDSGDTGNVNKLPLAFTPAAPLTLSIKALHADGTLDDQYDSFVRLSVRPGTVYSVNGGDNGRNVQLVNGVASGVIVPIVASYGETHIWAEDLGYVPVKDLARTPPPQCADGVDNDGDGTVDFPADPGCFASNDDSETGGTYAAGVSPVIHYQLPRISDVRGYSLNSGTATAFPGEQVNMFTGWNDATTRFDFDVVVTRIASDGFYATDVQQQTSIGYSSVFAYTFSAPTKLRVCDRLKAFSGTASDFFGFTEIGFPTWAVEYYDPAVRPCLVPDPTVLGVADLANTKALFRYESSLVRVLMTGKFEADGTCSKTTPGVCIHITKHFGAQHPAAPAYTPGPDASNCDLNNSGKVDFGDANESACNTACTNDPECSEFSAFAGQSNFYVVVEDTVNGTQGHAQINGSSAPGFDPVTTKGAPIKSFTGTLRYFSGGSQFTIEARCSDDIVTDVNAQPLSSNGACVRPRTDLELSQSN